MTIIRVGCYERVSTEEQALRGFSIDTQIDNLIEYCEKNKMKIVDHYTDEGISGAKPPTKRPALSRLLDDVKAGKIDMILFTKLDRWFRSVQEYYKVQEILEAHRVEWKAIHEDYDTTTANGRMAITIFLAIAQNEREKTAERIKVVFEHKRKNKEACFGGNGTPLGYMKEKDEDGVSRWVKDPETREMVEAFWDELSKYYNVKRAIRRMVQEYGYIRDEKGWYRMARNEMYCGIYKGVEEYCEPYISKEDWVTIQEKTKGTRSPVGERAYLFTSMMRCPQCKSVLCGTYDNKTYKGVKYEYRHYRCRHKGTTRCDFRRSLSELKMEKYLIANLDKLLREDIAKAELEKTKPKPKPKYNIQSLKERLRRLEVVYMAGNKPDDEYLAEQKEIKDLIAKAQDESPPAERNLQPLYDLLETDFRGIYEQLDQWERKRFWQSIIKEIILDDNKVKEVIFF